MICIESLAATPVSSGAGNPELSIFDGSNNSAGIFHLTGGTTIQTPSFGLQNSVGTFTTLTVSGSVPLGDCVASVATYDGTAGAQFRVKDLQGTLDQTATNSSVGTVTPFNSSNEVIVHGRIAPNAGAAYASTIQGWIITSGSLNTVQINAVLAAWQARLQYNPPTTQNVGVTVLSGTLTSGSCTFGSPILSSANHPWAQATGTGGTLTNDGRLTVLPVSGTTATVLSENSSDNSPIELFVAPW
jgi:hypothetical protein